MTKITFKALVGAKLFSKVWEKQGEMLFPLIYMNSPFVFVLEIYAYKHQHAQKEVKTGTSCLYIDMSNLHILPALPLAEALNASIHSPDVCSVDLSLCIVIFVGVYEGGDLEKQHLRALPNHLKTYCTPLGL